MAQRYLITLPNGTKHFQVYDRDTDRCQTVQEIVIDHWESYCNHNWLNYKRDDNFCPEMKVKWLLNGCGNYLLDRTGCDDVLSDYRSKKIKNTEIPMTSCTDDILEKLESDEYRVTASDNLRAIEKKKKKPDSKDKKVYEPTRFEKMQKRFGYQRDSSKLTHAVVDTENCFKYDNRVYMIKNAPQYNGEQSEQGQFYKMNKVIIFTGNGHPEFFDENIEVLDEKNIEVLDEKNVKE